MIELTLLLNRESGDPLYTQLYHYIKKDILNGKLPADSRLPLFVHYPVTSTLAVIQSIWPINSY